MVSKQLLTTEMKIAKSGKKYLTVSCGAHKQPGHCCMEHPYSRAVLFYSLADEGNLFAKHQNCAYLDKYKQNRSANTFISKSSMWEVLVTF